MELLSPPSEIVVRSAKVPGYWAREVDLSVMGKGLPGRFFLFLSSLDKSFQAGDRLEIEGAFGEAVAAVFDDESRIYLKENRVILFVAWHTKKRIREKDRLSQPGKDQRT